jgi:hypothetical protein
MRRWLYAILLLSGCNPPSAPVDAPTTPDVGDFDGGTDAGPAPPDVCDELGLSRSPLADSTGVDFGDVAGDFTVNLLDGSTFHYATDRSGCESYVFLNYIPDLRARPSGAWFGDTLWNASAADPFLTEGPRNVQYFYTSDEADPAARRARLEAMQVALEDSLAFVFSDPAEQDFWRGRFHFVADRLSEIEGSVGAHYVDYLAYVRSPSSLVDLGDRGMAGAPLPFFFAIDRHQRFHAGDDLSPFVGGSPYYGMAAYVGHYYNHLFEIDERLDGDGAMVVPIVDGERTTTRVFNRVVTLPDAATMAAFNHLEIEIEITCELRNPFACSEWDRIADVQVCLNEDCSDRREIARWITPYWRRGPQHWTIDASAFLPLLSAGGETRFFVETGPEWERATEYVGTIALRLSNEADEPSPIGAVRVFTGGSFDSNYNAREPVAVEIPASATRVELVTILSGHGQVSGNNCAEWCDHRHSFSVNGTALPMIAHAGSVGSGLGCADHVRDGVPPNQLGNWAPERAYWCPGLPVEARRDDITALAAPGSSASIDYEGLYRTGAPAGGDIALSAYVVWYE